jgi:hypothetical protein
MRWHSLREFESLCSHWWGLSEIVKKDAKFVKILENLS